MIKSTHHGPIINDLFTKELTKHFFHQVQTFPDANLSIAWTGLQAKDHITRNLPDVPFCKTIQCGMDLMAKTDSVPLTFMFADIDGNIGMQSSGAYPDRGFNRTSRILPGWTGEFEWKGMVKPGDKPWVINPERGWLATTNNAITSRNSRSGVGAEVPSFSGRQIRAEQMLEEMVKEKSGEITEEDFIKMFDDTIDVHAEFMTPYLIRIARDNIRNNNFILDQDKVSKSI